MTDIIRSIEASATSLVADMGRLRDRIQMLERSEAASCERIRELERDRDHLLRTNEELRMELDFDAGQRAAERLRVDLDAAQEKILGASERCFLAEIEKMREAEPLLSMRELFALWKEHNVEVRAEERGKEVANAGGEALRSWLAGWVMGGFKQDKGLCGCGEWDCSDRERVYVRGRGFVSRYEVEREAAEREPPAPVPVPAPVAQKRPSVRERGAAPVVQARTWAQVAAGRK